MTAYTLCNPAFPDLDASSDTLEWNNSVHSGVYLCLKYQLPNHNIPLYLKSTQDHYLPLSNIKRGCITDTKHILSVADGGSHGTSGRKPFISIRTHESGISAAVCLYRCDLSATAASAKYSRAASSF